MKLTFLGPLGLTLFPVLGGLDGLSDKWSNWGVVSILVWFLFYTIKFWIPAIEAKKLEALDLQRREFLVMLSESQAGFLKTLKTIRIANNRERKATRRILREVVTTEKSQMEMILEISHTKERLIREMTEMTAAMRAVLEANAKEKQ